jgi:hypothetical protein
VRCGRTSRLVRMPVFVWNQTIQGHAFSWTGGSIEESQHLHGPRTMRGCGSGGVASPSAPTCRRARRGPPGPRARRSARPSGFLLRGGRPA